MFIVEHEVWENFRMTRIGKRKLYLRLFDAIRYAERESGVKAVEFPYGYICHKKTNYKCENGQHEIYRIGRS